MSDNTTKPDVGPPLPPLKVTDGSIAGIRGGADAARAAQRGSEPPPLKVSGAEGSPLMRAEAAMREKGYQVKEPTPAPAPREPKVTAGGLSDDAAHLLPEAAAKPTDYKFPAEVTGGEPMAGEDVVYAGQEFHKLGFPIGLAQQAVAAAHGAKALSDQEFGTSSKECIESIARGIEHSERVGGAVARERAQQMMDAVDDYVTKEVTRLSPQLAKTYIETSVGNNPVLIRSLYAWLQSRAARSN